MHKWKCLAKPQAVCAFFNFEPVFSERCMGAGEWKWFAKPQAVSCFGVQKVVSKLTTP